MMRQDAIIVGGGFAGLAAATYLGRARRKVLVLDTGKPRNRFATASHGFLGQDGAAPGQILATAREQVRTYPTVQVTEAEATSARALDDGFVVDLAGGGQAEAPKLILAFGLRDTLPGVPGLAERWGKTVLHCPYCHGFEFSDRPLGVLYRNERSIHQALLIAEWGPATIFMSGEPLAADQADMLGRRGVRIEAGVVAGLEGKGTALSAVRLADGQQRDIEALYISPVSHFSSPLAEQLGLTVTEEVLGPMIRTDDDRMTSVAGVYAAGDIARTRHSVSWAVADGVTAGVAAHRTLVFG